MDEKKREKKEVVDKKNNEGEDKPQEDIIATIHVLKNKTEVRKRVVTRHSKPNQD